MIGTMLLPLFIAQNYLVTHIRYKVEESDQTEVSVSLMGFFFANTTFQINY